MFVKDTNTSKIRNHCTQYLENIIIYTIGPLHNPSFNRWKRIKSNLDFIFFLWKELYWIRTQQLKINSQQIA